ncbi:hypothetical protein AM420_000514 [Klebsiella pneumoniae]|uniref:hypothetical protein n=1 Tax=Klebsiella pneumoniae TaxID=573 RepID=UPI0008FB7EB4|nr:hypothetical protein [Klebsiella pneumoniae]ART01791.1 hypothetical protein B8O09_22760 [Klebsiella pneumoniae]ASC23280.1 hypothetical protein AM386_16320 [Klebsiella pneumoniae]OKN58317.1 hypothetical protein AM420_000514 [Klebsiella pneumoniae]
MTSKLTRLTDEELAELAFYAGESTCHPDPNYQLGFESLATGSSVLSIVRELQERRKAAMDSEPNRNPVLAYADSYRDMAKQGVESVPIWSVITDLERNIAPLYRHAQPAPVVPDEMLCDFYEVNNWTDLVRELVKHVEQLQDSARRNVKPWEDTFPETLLPAYIERIKHADEACRAAMLNGGKP